MGKKVPFVVTACLVFVCSAVNADEVYLSLTRKAESMKDMPTNVSVITAEQIREKRVADVG
ncbi:MAG: hypothetical protein ACYC5N_07895, partial [Endomicrobiales bacterium]